MSSMMDKLREAKIVDVIDGLSEHSTAKLRVSFGGKEVAHGAKMTPQETAHAPDVRIETTSSTLHTLICTDPDAPDPKNPVRREWLHWVVTNIPGGDVKSGNEITGYFGPAPPTGTHRYIFLLYAQPNQKPLQVSDASGGDLGGRAHFNTRKFAAAHNLGDPVDCVWFNAHK